MSVTSAAWQVLGFRVLDRVGKGLRTPARDAWIAEVTPPRIRGRAFGFHRGADHLGAVMGSLLAWWLLSSQVEVRDVLVWSLAPGAFAFLVLLFVLKGRDEPSTGELVTRPEQRRSSLPVFWPPVLTLSALVLFRLPEALLILRLQDLGVSLVVVPLAWAGLHVVRTLASYPGGWLSDHIGPRLTVLAGGLVAGGAAVLLASKVAPGMAVLIFLTFGLVAGLTEAPERSLVSRLAPVSPGRGFGAYHAVTGIAALPAALLFGWMYERYGGGTALFFSAGATGLTLLYWLRVRIPEPGERLTV
jgi:MFS family permease